MGEVTAISWCDHTFNPWIAMERHPDKAGGSDAAMAELNAAKAQALKEIGA
ncbi:hypothetical protein [Mesorhizobium sp.]|uniref:hypothetical protein n=1 Tax=Mesorhizobium sp. TaxID=1871066 RepID=UPI0025C0F689|nr:hypothetical protein [Mesorhizobium sp.]